MLSGNRQSFNLILSFWVNGVPLFRPFTKIAYQQGYINTPNVVPLQISFQGYSSELLIYAFPLAIFVTSSYIVTRNYFIPLKIPTKVATPKVAVLNC